MTPAKAPDRFVLEGVPYIGPDLHRADPATGVRRCLERGTPIEKLKFVGGTCYLCPTCQPVQGQ